jgi:hypothetical protein
MIRFCHREGMYILKNVADVFAELVLTNSHDGGSTVNAGLFSRAVGHFEMLNFSTLIYRLDFHHYFPKLFYPRIVDGLVFVCQHR